MAKSTGKPKATSPSVTTGSSSYLGSSSASGSRSRSRSSSSSGSETSRSRSPPAKTSDVAKKIRASSPSPKKASPVKKLRTPTPESTVLHVGCLTRNVNEAHLKEIFGNYGEVVNVELAMDRSVNLPKDIQFSQVVMEVWRQIEGAYALIFKSPHYPNELVACKCGSPLLLGVKEVGEAENRSAFAKNRGAFVHSQRKDDKLKI